MRTAEPKTRVRSRYRGEQYDSDLGLYYLRARYYNPTAGRFMSRDPLDGQLGDLKTLHKYLYAGGDPVDAMDRTGRESMFETGQLEERTLPELEEGLFRLANAVKKYFGCISFVMADIRWMQKGETWVGVSLPFLFLRCLAEGGS